MHAESSSAFSSLFPISTTGPNAFGMFGSNPRDSVTMYEDLLQSFSASSSPVSSVSSKGSFCGSPTTTESDYDGSTSSDAASSSSTLVDDEEAVVKGDEKEGKKEKKRSSFFADFDLADCFKRMFAGI